MKKAMSVLVYLLFVLTILYPVGVITAARVGYSFELASVTAFAIIIAALCLSIVVINLAFKICLDNKMVQIILSVSTPVSLINAVFLIFSCPKICVIASVFLSAGCCCYLTFKCVKNLSVKFPALVVSASMLLPICVLSFFIFLLGNFGQDTIVQTVESPNGKYYAQVVFSDQGALGGDTQVYVYNNSSINLVFAKIKKKPRSVYFGEWYEYKKLQICWNEENCLIINGVEYEIE